MKKEEMLSRITAIGACDDETERRELLAQLSEDAGKDYDAMENLTATNATLTEDNEKLRSANMKLFLRVGTGKTEERDVDTPKDKRSFDNLFNDKGGIK